MKQEPERVPVTREEERVLEEARAFFADPLRHRMEDAAFFELWNGVPQHEADAALAADVRKPFTSSWYRVPIGLTGMFLGGLAGDAFGGDVQGNALERVISDFDSGALAQREPQRTGRTRRTLVFAEALLSGHVALRRSVEVNIDDLVAAAFRRWWELETRAIPSTAGGWLVAEPAIGPSPRGEQDFPNTCRDYLNGDQRPSESPTSHLLAHVAPLALFWDRVYKPRAGSERVQERLTMFGRAVAERTHPGCGNDALAVAALATMFRNGPVLPHFERLALELRHLDGHEAVLEPLQRAVSLLRTNSPAPVRDVAELARAYDPNSALGAMTIAVYSAMYGIRKNDFVQGLAVSTLHDGDREATAAVCGQLIGVHAGPTPIPRPWLERLDLYPVTARIAADAAKELGPEPPETEDWFARYGLVRRAAADEAETDHAATRERGTRTEIATMATPDDTGYDEDPSVARIHILQSLNKPTLPPVSEQALGYAGSHPDSWMFYTDSSLPPDAPVTMSNVTGARYIDENGEFTKIWINPDFVPQPAYAKRQFHNHLELVLWRTIYGHSSLGELVWEFANNSHLVLVDPESGGPRTVENVDVKFGKTRREIMAYTSEPLLPPDPGPVQLMSGSDILNLYYADEELWIRINDSPEGDGLGVEFGMDDLVLLQRQNHVHFERLAAERDAAAESATPAAGENTAQRPPAPPVDPRERFFGVMLGGAVGDALGYAVEFQSIDMIRRHHGEDGLTAPVLRGGVAEISDDTQMMLFTLEGLIRAHVARRIEPRDNDPVPEVQHAYQRWLHTQNRAWESAGGPYAQRLQRPDGWLITTPGLFANRAPGSTCMSALVNFAQTHQIATPQNRINDSKGCGGVMRAAPVAVWSNDPGEVFFTAARTAALTHGHPSGFLSAGVLAVIVHQLLRDVGLREAVGVARDVLVRWPGHEEQLRALDAAVALAERGRVSPEELKEQLGEGWVGEEALAIGLYAVLATDDLRDALLLSVNHSGDSDSTGIVCGNIGGAVHGARAIPPEWLQTLELREVIETLTNDALAEFSPGPPTDPTWTQRYPAW